MSLVISLKFNDRLDVGGVPYELASSNRKDGTLVLATSEKSVLLNSKSWVQLQESVFAKCGTPHPKDSKQIRVVMEAPRSIVIRRFKKEQ